jgi:acyl-CoA synthetase (NDP forming)
MVRGPEVILGAKKEEGYGHLVMFGLGGIFTEILKDNQFTIAPLGLQESEAIVRRIRSIKLLEGCRGQKGMSIPVLADYLTRLGMLVCDFPQISEVDFNPVKGEDENLFVVDCRIII